MNSGNLWYELFEHNIISRNINSYHIYIRFFKDIIIRGKEIIDYYILSLKLGDFIKLIYNAGSRALFKLNRD